MFNPNLIIIEAENWDIHNDSLNVSFKLPDDLELNDRIVTMVMYANNKTEYPSIPDTDDGNLQRERIPLASYIIPNKTVSGFE